MKEPQIQIRRRRTDALPLLILFGVELGPDGLEAELYHVTGKVRAGTVVKHAHERYILPALSPGFQMVPLRLPHA